MNITRAHLIAALAIAVECERDRENLQYGYTVNGTMVNQWVETLIALREGKSVQIVDSE